MARRRRGRPVNGILVLDKPTGLSSNQALQRARGIYNASKAGHTGSLDPLATGVLPVCFGEATKFSQFLLDADKGYRSTFVLGVETTTGDSDGEVRARRDCGGLAAVDVEDALRQFCGAIRQLPPMYSALKHQGQPLYKLARQGVEVEREIRVITIYALEMEAFRDASQTGGDPEVDVRVHCSKGTYIRTLAEDLGRLLGCGAHVKILRRISAGPFVEARAYTLEVLQQLRDEQKFDALDGLLLPVDCAVQHFPAVTLPESLACYILQGQAVMASGVPLTGLARLYDQGGGFLGIGEMLEDGRLGPRRLIATQ